MMKSIKDVIAEDEGSIPVSAAELLAAAEKAKAFREKLAEERKEDEVKKQQPPTPQVYGLVEIVRSFSYKLNVGNYESRDFFCSQKIECYSYEAAALSEQAHQFCLQQVRAAVGAYLAAKKEQQQGAKEEK